MMRTRIFASLLAIFLVQPAFAQIAPGQGDVPLPADWFPLIPGAFAKSHEGLSVFSAMFESETPLFDDLPDPQTHARLVAILQDQCRSSAMTAQIDSIRAQFLKMGLPAKDLFQAIRMSVRHDGTAPDGTRLVTVFETLLDQNPDGSCGARRAVEPALLMTEPETRIIRG